MKKTTKATDYYHAPPYNYNCAQAILKRFQQEFAIPEKMIEEFSAFGGGRVEGNICGALYAANTLLAQRGGKPLDEQFGNRCKSIRCKEIKGVYQTPCDYCVETAELLLSLSLKQV